MFHTLRYLRPRQIAYQLYYRATGKLTKHNAARTQVQRRVAEPGSAPVSFDFLNREVSFPSPAEIDWNYTGQGKLWTYNLNYFEFLGEMSADRGLALIEAWIDKERSHRDGWEPYPISLRLVSWIAFFYRVKKQLTGRVTASIRRQYAALRTKSEYHLGGNHLLENALALTLTSYYLKHDAGHHRAARLLSRELKAQYLPDGAHYELSPMYHIVLLDRMLTVYHCLTTPTAPAAPPKIAITLRQSLTRQLAWIAAFATEDGRYARFNDATAGIAPAVPAVLKRAAGLGLAPMSVMLGSSGYRRWKNGLFDLWIDAAAIGPNDIPGHAHADNLTFVLHVSGRPVVVDPAVSTYEKNARRAWERSTAAHNTVAVNDENSSDVWGGFRVGRRAFTRLEHEAECTLTASHSGYSSVHRRTFALTATGLRITDELVPDNTGIARFHFSHDLSPVLSAKGCIVSGLRVSWSAGEAKLVPYEQAVGWNVLRPAWCLEVAFSGEVSFYVTTD